MANGINMCIIAGNLAADGELRFTQSGTAVLNLRVAVGRSEKDQNGQWKETSDFLSAVVWGKRAEGLAKHCTKGKPVTIQGSLKPSSYEARDGTKRYKVEIKVDEIVLGGGRSGGEQRSNGDAYPRDDFDAPNDMGGGMDDDSIPFQRPWVPEL